MIETNQFKKGVCIVYKGEPVTKPIVCRIDGNNAEEGRRILNEAEHDLIELVETMDDAARRVAELAASRAAGK